MGSLLESADVKFVHFAQILQLYKVQKILAERNLDVNVEEYEEARREQQERSRVATHSKRGGEKEG